MKIARLLCMVWACAPLIGGIAIAADPDAKAGRAESRESTPVESGNAAAARPPVKAAHAVAASPRHGRPVVPQRGTVQPVRTNTDRLHALLAKSARGRTAKASVRSGAGNRTSAAGKTSAAVHGANASAVGLPTFQVSKAVTRFTTPAKTVTPKSSMLGGAHAAGPPRLGGPAIDRAASGRAASGRAASGRAASAPAATAASVDGTQVHRRF
jgi:hypothetical protein